ncbi:MAG: hypothetical protein FWE50_03355 [Alphaproteobacteria bacterium]|nr:hypothetical protein [Alphaproteobacteria bacterium]
MMETLTRTDLCKNRPCAQGLGKCPYFSRFSGLPSNFIPQCECVVLYYADLIIENKVGCSDCKDRGSCAKNCTFFSKYRAMQNIAKRIISDVKESHL